MKLDIQQFYENSGHHSIVKKKDIPAVVETLTEVRRKNHGRLTARLTLAEAKRNPDGVLAAYVFKDGAAKAADKWYLQQAGEVLRSVITYIVVNGKKMPSVRWVTSVVEKRPDRPGVSYNFVETIPAMLDDRYREQMVCEAIAGAKTWQKKYQTLMAYSKAIKRIGKAILRATKNL